MPVAFDDVRYFFSMLTYQSHPSELYTQRIQLPLLQTLYAFV